MLLLSAGDGAAGQISDVVSVPPLKMNKRYCLASSSWDRDVIINNFWFDKKISWSRHGRFVPCRLPAEMMAKLFLDKIIQTELNMRKTCE